MSEHTFCGMYMLYVSVYGVHIRTHGRYTKRRTLVTKKNGQGIKANRFKSVRNDNNTHRNDARHPLNYTVCTRKRFIRMCISCSFARSASRCTVCIQ